MPSSLRRQGSNLPAVNAGCSGHVNFGHSDRLFRCHHAFVDAGRHIAQYRMQTLAVVGSDDVSGDIALVFRYGSRYFAARHAPSQAKEEAFGDRVVPTVSFAARAANEAMPG